MSTDNDQTQTNTNANAPADLVQDELSVLKHRATVMGIQFHPSIGLESLRKKVNDAIEAEGPVVNTGTTQAAPETNTDASASERVSAPVAEVVETQLQRRTRKIREANRLVRIRVTCMNPAKKEWEGELFTVGNGAIGTFSKFVPFNNEEGYHVPHVIYEQMKQRECQIFVQGKDSRGNKIRQSKLIREFAIEVLETLTVEELNELAQRQAMANGTAAR